jgi:7-cyano-7-deazaguanine synthase
MKTLVLLSGGLDSATVLSWAKLEGDEVWALAFDYGQPHRIELERARILANGLPFEVMVVPGLPLVNDVVFAGRNLVFAALAIAKAQAEGFDRIAVGCNASDWERFPDCRPPFWQALRTAAEAYGIGVATPLIHMSKREVAELARHLGVPIELTWSCYSPRDGEPCRECLACTVRQEALSACS